MKTRFILVTALALLAAYGLAAPYLTVNEMRTAARERDAQTLAAHIDFPGVRQSFKDQFRRLIDSKLPAESSGNLLAKLGAGVATAVIDSAIEFMVTPEGIRRLMSGVKPYEEDTRERSSADGRKPFASFTSGYESLNRFVATVKTDDGEPIDFVLHRRGLRWQLAEVRLPLQAAP
jgi:Protein of unknown function (DUF2939)